LRHRQRADGEACPLAEVHTRRRPDRPRLEAHPSARPCRRHRLARLPERGPMNLADIEGTTPFAVCRLLSDLARLVPAGQSIVEIGVYKGRTLAHLADGARKGHGALVYGVDVFDLPVPPPGRHRVSDIHAREALRSTGLEDRVTIVKASSADAAAAFDGPPVGLLFLDGGHTREAVLAD